jgi:DNA-binding MarR family transcriptional regulator
MTNDPRTDPIPPIGQAIRAALNRKALADVRHRAALARLLGLTDSDVLAILHLARAGQLTTGGTAALVQRLERAELITRAPHPRDGRSSVLRLTDEAEHSAGAAYAPLVAQLERLVGDLEPDGQQLVERFLLQAAQATEAQADALVKRVEEEAARADSVPSPGLWA